MTDDWELESAVARHERSPGTFWIPPEAERRNLRPGQAVKLVFRIRVVFDQGWQRKHLLGDLLPRMGRADA